jgi:hypothetical protein
MQLARIYSFNFKAVFIKGKKPFLNPRLKLNYIVLTYFITLLLCLIKSYK